MLSRLLFTMKYVPLIFFLFQLLNTTAQKTDTFSIKKDAATKSKFVIDTFVQQTYLSNKTEKSNHIVYRTGIKITGQNTLIYFKATQSILDSLGVLEDKNASVGEYKKVTCVQKNDSIFFLIKYRLPSMRNKGTTVAVTKAYSGVKANRSINMDVNTVADSGEVRPKNENEIFSLFKEELILTRRKK